MNLYGTTVWCEGSLGSGKTTFCREVGRRLNLRVLEEPVDANPYLTKFYADPKRYATGMQFWLLHRRYATQQLAAYEATGVGGYQGTILDRSLAGDRVFAKMHMKCGNIDPMDWETYEMAYSIMARNLLPPTLLIFLDVQPQTAYDRMKKRNRTAEVGVSLQYLIDLREGYQELLKEAETGLMPWSHAIRVSRTCWDPDTITETQWDAVAKTVADMCKR